MFRSFCTVFAPHFRVAIRRCVSIRQIQAVRSYPRPVHANLEKLCFRAVPPSGYTVHLLGFSNITFVRVWGLRRHGNTLWSEHRSSTQRVARDSVFWICWAWEGPIFPLVELSEHDRWVDPFKLSIFTLISGWSFQVYQLLGSEILWMFQKTLFFGCPDSFSSSSAGGGGGRHEDQPEIQAQVHYLNPNIPEITSRKVTLLSGKSRFFPESKTNFPGNYYNFPES